LADLARKEEFVEVARMLREPLEDERFRRGHLLMRCGRTTAANTSSME
jgi:hypothetical protein